MAMEKPTIQGAAAGCKPLTMFVQTNTYTFREVVQQLTGPSQATAAKGEATKVSGVKRTSSKLHERRQYLMRPKLAIVKPTFNCKSGASANQHTCFSPSKSRNSSFPHSPMSGNSSHLPSPIIPSTISSRLSILEEENKEESAIPEVNREEEEKAIKERRFYLHPSPRSKPGYTEPELLTLFPLASANTSEEV